MDFLTKITFVKFVKLRQKNRNFNGFVTLTKIFLQEQPFHFAKPSPKEVTLFTP